MNIHLVTVAGGEPETLPAMLEHYRAQGVESFFVNAHLKRDDDPVREFLEDTTRRFGCGLATVNVGEWGFLQQELYLRQRQMYPDDWFVLADSDELQRWPRGLRASIEEADAAGWQYIRGCLVDRFARDGRFPALQQDQPISPQYPLAAFFSNPALSADPRKVVAVKGAVPLVRGQHHALEGKACPMRFEFIHVDHYKWTAGVVERLAARAEEFRRLGFPHGIESQKFVEYHRITGGQITLDDPHLLVADADPEYVNWPRIQKLVQRL